MPALSKEETAKAHDHGWIILGLAPQTYAACQDISSMSLRPRANLKFLGPKLLTLARQPKDDDLLLRRPFPSVVASHKS